MQTLAAILFYIVFVQLFIILSIFMWASVTKYLKEQRQAKLVNKAQEENPQAGK